MIVLLKIFLYIKILFKRIDVCILILAIFLVRDEDNEFFFYSSLSTQITHLYMICVILFCSLQSEEILSLNNSSQIFHSLSNAPGSVTDVNELIKVSIFI